MKHVTALAVVLVAVWFLWSGHTDALLVSLGAASCALVVWIALRMGTVDAESVPLARLPQLAAYLPWLALEVVKSNLDVARRVLHPSLPISPRTIEVPASQRSELGQVLYANSITLTPGTVSTRVHGARIEVHALTAEAAAGLETGEMNRRCSRVAGER